MAVRLAVKPPSGGDRSLLSSGHTDYGLNLALAKHFRKRSLYLNSGYVVSGDWWVVPGLDIADVWTVLLAYEHWLGARRSLVIQNLTHSSFLAEATNSDLSALSHEVTVGMKFRSQGGLGWAISLTENYATFKSSPDFGFHLGLTCLF